jgi:hypothetical protein
MKKKPTTETPEFLNGLTKLELLKYALGGGRERKILEEDRNEKLNSLMTQKVTDTLTRRNN